MADRHGRQIEAGVLLGRAGLKPRPRGRRIRYDGDGLGVIDGRFAETGEAVAGYTLIEVPSRAGAWVERARRCADPAGRGEPAEIAARPLYEPDGFEPSSRSTG